MKPVLRAVWPLHRGYACVCAPLRRVVGQGGQDRRLDQWSRVTHERAWSLSGLLRQSDENALGASDVTEPIHVVTLDHFVARLPLTPRPAGCSAREIISGFRRRALFVINERRALDRRRGTAQRVHSGPTRRRRARPFVEESLPAESPCWDAPNTVVTSNSTGIPANSGARSMPISLDNSACQMAAGRSARHDLIHVCEAARMSDEIWSWDATRVAAAVRAKEVSCREVTASVLHRIDAANPRLNAITVVLADDAMAAAHNADDALLNGAEIGALHGVAITIKENIDVTGQATPNGLPALANLIAPGDSPLVANVRRAGAIIVGRTNTPELSMRPTTYNPLRGRTFNPWDPATSPGGSSGGAGAAAAAGFGPLHHGNDIAGSLRYPASLCGVATIKPTQGRIPAFNPSATTERSILASLMSAQGTIARSVADVRLGTKAMVHGDPRDPWWVPAPFNGPPEPAPITVAVARDTFGYRAHPEILALIDQAAARLTDAGYHVVDVEPPSVEEAYRGWWSTGLTEIKHTLGPIVASAASQEMQTLFETQYAMGEILDGDGYRNGLTDRTRQCRNWSMFLAEHPLVLTPLLMRPAYGASYDAEPGGLEDIFRASIYCCSINFLGLPAGYLTTGIVDNLPSGVQIVGRRFREDLVLDAMTALEARQNRVLDQLWERQSPPEPLPPTV